MPPPNVRFTPKSGHCGVRFAMSDGVFLDATGNRMISARIIEKCTLADDCGVSSNSSAR
jgi:hypothetical protein